MDEIDKIVDGFLNYLKLRKKENLLPEIIRRLSRIQSIRESTAEVISAFPLSSDEEEKIRVFLKKQFGKDFFLKIKIAPEIIGGLLIKVNDLIIDQSIAGQLRTLKNER
jgi:F-type H+-transporting ATPase subunit delta